MEKYVGKIVNFLSRGQYNSYGVAKFILLENKNKSLIITGEISSMNTDNYYNIEGKFEWNPINKKNSFKVSNFSKYLNDDEDYIVNFLSSNSFPGIGKLLAKKIYQKYQGKDIFQKILEDPSGLENVIEDDSKRSNFLSKVDEFFNVNNLENIFLSKKLKLDFLNILKNKTNSEKEREFILKNDFFEFAYQNSLSPFDEVDKVHCAFNDALNLDQRVSWFAWSIVNNNLNSSKNTYMNYESMMLELMKMFPNLSQNNIKDKLSYAKNNNILYFKKPNNVYTRESFEDEEYIVNTLYRLSILNSFVIPYEEDLIESNFIETQEWMKNKIKNDFEKFNELQKKAITEILNNNILIITGGPGTGKSIVLSAIVKMLSLFKKFKNLNDFAIVAPTGRAATRIKNSTGLETSTIHRLIGYSGSAFKYNIDNPIYKKVLVVDECSMIDQSLFANLLRGVSEIDKLILVGDIDQFPSINYGNVFSDLIKLNQFPIVRLSDNIRQGQFKEGSEIIELAYSINQNKLEDFNFEDCKNISLVESDTDIKLFIKNTLKNLNASPNDEIDRIQFITPQKNINLGVKNLNNWIQPYYVDTSSSNFYSRGDYKYFVGDKIIYTENNVELGVFNGDIGKIRELVFDKKRFISATVVFNEVDVVLNNSNFINIELAYACTSHKTQGGEYENVIIVLDDKNDRGFIEKKMLYTSVTRAKKKLFIYCNKEKLIHFSKRRSRSRLTSIFEAYNKIKLR